MVESASSDSGAQTLPPVDAEHSSGWHAFATLGEFLRDDDWHPQRLDDKPIYRVYFTGEHGDVRCYAQIRVDLEQFLFYVIAPIKAPAPVLPAVIEYITRANYGLRIGCFELDHADGEIRFRSSLDFEGETLTPGLMRNAIYPAVHTMDFYLPGLLAVMYGNKTPEQAIGEVEGKVDSEGDGS